MKNEEFVGVILVALLISGAIAINALGGHVVMPVLSILGMITESIENETGTNFSEEIESPYSQDDVGDSMLTTQNLIIVACLLVLYVFYEDHEKKKRKKEGDNLAKQFG